MKAFYTVLAVVLLFGCTTSPPPVTPLSDEESFAEISEREHADIIEAVFRHMFAPEKDSNEVSHYLNAVHKVYFVAVGQKKETDPSPNFIRRFSDVKTPVKPIS